MKTYKVADSMKENLTNIRDYLTGVIAAHEDVPEGTLSHEDFARVTETLDKVNGYLAYANSRSVDGRTIKLMKNLIDAMAPIMALPAGQRPTGSY